MQLTLKQFFKKVKGKLKIFTVKTVDNVCPYVYEFHKEKYVRVIVDEIQAITEIVSPAETLSQIKQYINRKKNGAYMRFGDGDVYLSMGKNEMMQHSNELLTIEMNEAFALKGKGIFKALAIHSKQYGFEKEMFIGNHLQTDESSNYLLSRVFPFFVGFNIYSPVALHYMACYYPDETNEFLKLLKSNSVLFIGNENTPREIIQKLFGEVPHITTPTKNSYDQIDEIENKSLKFLHKQKMFGVVIVAMGCSGRILMKRLYTNNFPVFYFDFGSLLDGICGNITRPWLKENINYEKLLSGL